MSPEPPVVVGLSAVIVAVTRESPRILTIAAPEQADSVRDVLPHGPLDPEADRTLELTLRSWVRERTGLDLGYVEQLYTFGDADRAARPTPSGPRVISVAYLALVREDRPTGPAEPRWRDWYTFFPWEDWREGPPEVIREAIAPALSAWTAEAPRGPLREERRERAGIAFGLEGAGWDADRVLDRYEILYEVKLVDEALRDRARPVPTASPASRLGRAMGMDHRRILATGLGRIRGKLRYRPVAFELLSETFTLLNLQRVVEALVGLRLHKQNFRRLVERGGSSRERAGWIPAQAGAPRSYSGFAGRSFGRGELRGSGFPGPGERPDSVQDMTLMANRG